MWAPGPAKVASAVRAWLGDSSGEALRRAAACARRLAYPNAAADIATEIGCLAGLE